jgi:phosphate:Na+ symporter
MPSTRPLPQPSPRHTRIALTLAGGALIWLLAGPALAAEAAQAKVDWLQLGMGLVGGLALFLFGMEQMSDGLKAAAGDSLKTLLSKLTTNRFSGALTGAFVTAVLNSSSVTTVLVVGFITAGIMTLSQSIGVIMGANIGSTVTAQIVAFNVTQYALLPVAVGFLMLFTGKRDRTRHYGMMIMGLGLVFFGMGVMSQAMNPLRSYAPFLELMQRMENPVLGILVGAVFTGLVQSSAATTGIAIVMATEGLMSLPAGIALALGSNIGTCVTALLAAIGKPVEAVRAAMAHVLFNVFGVLLWVAFIPQLAALVEWLSPTYPDLTGTAKAAAEVPRQIANAHTTFNLINTLVFLGFTTWLARLVERLVPERAPEEGLIIEPKYLDESVLETPSLALEAVRREAGRMGGIAEAMYADIRPAVMDRDRERVLAIGKEDDKVDILEEAITGYLTKLRKQVLSEHQSREFLTLLTAVENLESLADVIETGIVELAEEFIAKDLQPGETTRQMMGNLYADVGKAVSLAVTALRDNDQRSAQEVLALKGEIRRQADALYAHKAEGMRREEESYLQRLRIEMTLIDQLRRIYTLAKRVAKEVLPEEVASKE